MVRTVEGYVVLKGSKIRESDTKSTPSWAKKKRAQLVADGTIKDGIFTRNELFSSPSGASDLIITLGSLPGVIFIFVKQSQSICIPILEVELTIGT